MTIWPWKLSAAALVSLFASIGALTLTVIASNAVTAGARAIGVDAAAIPLIAISVLAALYSCIWFPSILLNETNRRRDAQAMALGVACLCAAGFLLTV